jgi:hypothetical protein
MAIPHHNQQIWNKIPSIFHEIFIWQPMILSKCHSKNLITKAQNKKIMYFKSINSIFFVLNIHLPAAEEVIFVSVVRKNDAILVMDL